MNARIVIDKAGRLVLPKPVRDELRLKPGDTLELRSEADKVILSPVHPAGVIQKEEGVWVYRSGTPADVSLTELIAAERQKRIEDLLR